MFFNLFFTLESLRPVLLLSWLAVMNACSVEIKATASVCWRRGGWSRNGKGSHRQVRKRCRARGSAQGKRKRGEHENKATGSCCCLCFQCLLIPTSENILLSICFTYSCILTSHLCSSLQKTRKQGNIVLEGFTAAWNKGFLCWSPTLDLCLRTRLPF